MTDQSPENPHQGSAPNYFEEDNLSVTDILLVLARHIKVILITPTIFCSMTIIYVLFIADPVYTSTSKIMSSNGGGGNFQAVGIAAQFGINLSTGQEEEQWAYSEIIKSRTLARAVLKRMYDTEEFGIQKPLIQIITHGNDEPEYGTDRLEIMAVNILINEMIGVSENIKTAIYTVNIHASEPRLAAEINKAMLEELDTHQQNFNRSKTSKARKFIEERIIDAEKELMIAEENLKIFLDRNRRIENSPMLLLEQQRLTREVMVLTGVFTTLKQQYETTKIEEVKEADYVVILDPPEVPLFPSKPMKRLMVILAGCLGIGMGIVIGFVRDYAENNEDAEKNKLGKAKGLVLQNMFELIPVRVKNWIGK